MASTQRKALSTYRRRLKRRGVVRLEVHVRKDDAALVRGVVKALADPEREVEARALLRERFGAGKANGLKALLSSAPLEGIDLSRDPALNEPRPLSRLTCTPMRPGRRIFKLPTPPSIFILNFPEEGNRTSTWPTPTLILPFVKVSLLRSTVELPTPIFKSRSYATLGFKPIDQCSPESPVNGKPNDTPDSPKWTLAVLPAVEGVKSSEP